MVAGAAVRNLHGRGLTVQRRWTGSFRTALDMAGCSLSVLPVDDELLTRLDAPTSAPAWPASVRPASFSGDAPVAARTLRGPDRPPLPTGPLPTGPLPTGPLPTGPLPTGPLPTGPTCGPDPAGPTTWANGCWVIPTRAPAPSPSGSPRWPPRSPAETVLAG